MLKKEFLKELEDRLQMLNEKERKDMIEEYSQHISMRMESGMKEEEAIDDFGNIDDLILFDMLHGMSPLPVVPVYHKNGAVCR